MGNSKTKHSVNLRNKTNQAFKAKRKAEGYKNVTVSLAPKYQYMLKKLRITNTFFIQLALEKLDENGNVKFNTEII